MENQTDKITCYRVTIVKMKEKGEEEEEKGQEEEVGENL